MAHKRLSQDDIEHDILRKQFRDPRIHFAIICASMGCPPLPRTAYTEANVQARLEEETRKYLNSPRGTRIDYAENTLHVSKLFDWFAGDFIEKSGSILAYMRPYLHEETLSFLTRKPKISYLEYNWALNAQAPLARIFHEWPTATADMGVLPGVLGSLTLRRTVKVRLGPEFLRLPGCTPIFTVS